MFRIFLVLAILSCVLSSASCSTLVANYFTDAVACASGLSAQAYIPMGKCIMIPEIPPSLNVTVPFKSFKSDCTQNADGSIATANKIYATSSSCGGLGVPVKETIPAGCNSGGTFTCAADISQSDAFTKGWPAVGMFFGDSSCKASAWDVQVAFAANTCVALSGKKGSGSVIVTPSDTEFDAKGWSGVADCSGAPTKSYALPIGTCSPVALPGLKGQRLEMYKSSLHAFSALLGSAIDLEVSPKLVEWLRQEIEKTTDSLTSGAPIFAKAGIAGKL